MTQNDERAIDSLLEVLKEKILRKEDCERILNQIGALCNPNYTACKVVYVKKPKFLNIKKSDVE